MIQRLKYYKKYFFYALSIIISRGLEYVVLFYAAYFLTKDSYGELEFYKKIIELFAVGLAFGLPSLLLTYTKSDDSKVYLNILGIFFVLAFALCLIPLFWMFDYQFLLIPILFHAIFFNNGIMPVFFITMLGSTKASIYKTITSLLFYSGIFLLLVFNKEPERVFITINHYLIFVGLFFFIFFFRKFKIELKNLKRYYKLFKKLLISSLTLVVSNFANIMFLYTDIMIIRVLSTSANVDIANYSFALNIANMLVLVPLTMVQVDIEKIKKSYMVKKLNKKIIILLVIMAFVVALGYYFLINTYFYDYKQTMYLFLLILLAKCFQSMSVIHGAIILIKKKFGTNLKINLSVLLLNLLLSFLLFKFFHVFGVAIASVCSLFMRYIVLRQFSGYKAYGS